jgi:hypothetical protein
VIVDDLDLSISLPVTQESEAPPPAAPAEFEVLVPHEAIALNGVLCCGQPLPRHRSDIAGIVLQPLINLVRQVTDWRDPAGDEDQYLGDYRFLVLDAMTASGINTFVQIWSEPFDELTVEVGPGDRSDPARQAFADEIREALLGRGFEIGGNADNFRKMLPVPSKEDSPRVALEMLAILVDVLGYEGCTDLAYKLQQDSNLQAGHVVTGLSRSTLQLLCTRWGLRCRVSPDEDNSLEVKDLHQEFHLNLFYPQPHRKGDFWEIHCVVFLDLTQDQAHALLAEVNGKPHLMKAFATSEGRDPRQHVRLSFGINLAGGVTLQHVRCQIVEFLELVRRLRRQIGSI